MLSGKRKFGDHGLGRRVRARKDEESDVEVESSDAPSEEEVDASGSDGSEEEHDEGDSEEEESGDEPEEKDPALDLSSISFGDLAKAHAALSKKSKKKTPSAASSEAPTKGLPAEKPVSSKPTRADPAKRPAKRPSKHAPTEVTSKKPVSRRRDIIADTRPKPRDPRFDDLSGPINQGQFKKAYAFLDSYRDDEIKQLRESIKKTKDAGAKEDLKRQLKSLEGRRETERKKAEEERVLERHKREEKELVRQGKTPFYLKKAEQKKRLLTERFQGMSKGQAEKAIVKRRKKEAVKDRIEMEEVQRASGARAGRR